MIKVEPCRGCGRILFQRELAGLTIRCETEPLDAQTAVGALVGGTQLYRVTYIGGRPNAFGTATPAVLAALRTEPGERPLVVREHVCTNLGTEKLGMRAQTAPTGVTPRPVPANPPVAPTTPSRAGKGHSVPSAELRGSDDRSRAPLGSEEPRIDWGRVAIECSLCGWLLDQDDPGSYALIELGATLVDAFHTGSCP